MRTATNSIANSSPEHVLRHVFGFDSFRPNQREIVEAILQGRDVFAVMPTGGGKSLCYQLPAMLMPGVSVIVSPLLALMKDQVDSARETGIRAETLNSTTSKTDFIRVARGLESGNLDLLYVSPERLNTDGFIPWLKKYPLSLFAIDEAHCISEWGHHFRPDYRGLARIIPEFPNVPVAAFTATATDFVSSDIVSLLGLRTPLCVRASFDRPNLHYRVTYKDDLEHQLLAFFKEVGNVPGIIYRGTRKNVEETAEMLHRKGVNVRAYHAGMADAERQSVQEAFANDDINVIVATIAFGMGIDKSNVRFVVHADMPKNIEGYYQETGRAGRDGSPSQCLLLFGYQDILLQRSFIDELPEGNPKMAVCRQLDEMVRFAEADQCRRKSLLRYFGEEYPEPKCGNCDYCNDGITRDDATIDSQKALSAMVRTGNKFGIKSIIDILIGANTERIRKMGHDKLPTWGVGKDKDKRYWRQLINALVHKGMAAMNPRSEFPVPQITERGWAVLRGHETVELIRFPQRRTGSRKEKADVQMGVSPNDHTIFERLRKLRSEIARSRGVPPYVVFTDKSLLDMIRIKPQNREEFLTVNGVGEAKATAFCDIFLSALWEDSTHHPPAS